MSLDKKDIRDAFFDELYIKGSQNKDIVILSADMDAFSLRKFSKDFPEQYINVGVSEQNMINIAAGLALSGKIVFCYSIASFATMRCFEQIKVNICSLNLPVSIIGAGAGFSFGYDGPTHHGHQDLSSMRLIPEMTILELSSNDKYSLFIPNGFAHGYLVLSDTATVAYLQSNDYNPDYDKSINPLSLDFKWPLNELLLSEKDKDAISVDNYVTTFN